MRLRTLVLLSGVALAIGIGVWLYARFERASAPPGWEVVDRVADGDTIVLRGGSTVRLVQIDTPEVYFRAECFGEQASAETKELLRRGAFVRLVRDPATSSTDVYGRLLRYVFRRDGLNVNLRLVADGAAAPYFFDGARGRYAAALVRAAKAARSSGKGLWGHCPGTSLDPVGGVFHRGTGALSRGPSPRTAGRGTGCPSSRRRPLRFAHAECDLHVRAACRSRSPPEWRSGGQ